LTKEQKENMLRVQDGETRMARFLDGMAQGMGWGTAACLLYAVTTLAPLIAG
jgi:hypothetical protein